MQTKGFSETVNVHPFGYDHHEVHKQRLFRYLKLTVSYSVNYYFSEHIPVNQCNEQQISYVG